MTSHSQHPTFDSAATTEIYLDTPDQLIVRTFRHWPFGFQGNTAHHWSLVWNEFATRLGAQDGGMALSGFTSVMKELQCNGRRII